MNLDGKKIANLALGLFVLVATLGKGYLEDSINKEERQKEIDEAVEKRLKEIGND